MKITTFNPQIITKNGEKIKELFEELGFEVRHDRKEIGSLDFEGLRFKDENGSGGIAFRTRSDRDQDECR